MYAQYPLESVEPFSWLLSLVVRVRAQPPQALLPTNPTRPFFTVSSNQLSHSSIGHFPSPFPPRPLTIPSHLLPLVISKAVSPRPLRALAVIGPPGIDIALRVPGDRIEHQGRRVGLEKGEFGEVREDAG
jgi:hypothetical protein